MVAKAGQIGETPKDRAIAKLHTVPPKTFDPLFNDVCVHLFEESDVMSAGGIHIPGTSSDSWACRIGYVIAIGPEVKHVEPGDYIVVKDVLLTDHAKSVVRTAMPQVRYNNTTYHLLPEWMIAGKL